MKKGTKILLGVIAFIGVAVAAFFLFVKDKVMPTSNNPLTGNTAANGTNITLLSDKITSVENDLKNRISGISTTNSRPSILKSAGNPTSATGATGDFYINTDNSQVFLKTTATNWDSLANVYDGSADEYNDGTESFSRAASTGAVAQVRDLVYLLINQIKNPPITILNANDYESTQGAIDIHIPPTSLGVYGQEYILPTYRVINGGMIPTIYLTGTNGNQQIFTDQVFPNTTLIPFKDSDGDWTYIKA
jgi:hypothetical protein